MNRATVTAGILTASVALSAMAGPNWEEIHEAESHKIVLQLPASHALPLDHGPRALSTPWLNKEHKLEMLLEARKASAPPAARTIETGANHS